MIEGYCSCGGPLRTNGTCVRCPPKAPPLPTKDPMQELVELTESYGGYSDEPQTLYAAQLEINRLRNKLSQLQVKLSEVLVVLGGGS